MVVSECVYVLSAWGVGGGRGGNKLGKEKQDIKEDDPAKLSLFLRAYITTVGCV